MLVGVAAFAGAVAADVKEAAGHKGQRTTKMRKKMIKITMTWAAVAAAAMAEEEGR